MQLGVAYALGAAVRFGLSTPLAKMLLGAMSPLSLAGLLYIGSGLGPLLVFAVRRLVVPSRAGGSLPRRGEWRRLAGAIPFGGVAGPIALMYGLLTTTASAAPLLLNLEALFTARLAWFLFGENFDWRMASGMLALVAGGLVPAWTPGNVGTMSMGPALTATACPCWAFDNNLTRRISAGDAVAIAGLKGMAAAAVNPGLALSFGAKLPAVGIVGAAAGRDAARLQSRAAQPRNVGARYRALHIHGSRLRLA